MTFSQRSSLVQRRPQTSVGPITLAFHIRRNHGKHGSRGTCLAAPSLGRGPNDYTVKTGVDHAGGHNRPDWARRAEIRRTNGVVILHSVVAFLSWLRMMKEMRNVKSDLALPLRHWSYAIVISLLVPASTTSISPPDQLVTFYPSASTSASP
ncbi:hypothetical protein HJC23_005154 [Cyclotella cryptica]|uniref:Uncharacterized protein n=1 Tax=Cyclotella cryptica TaxID=29204 RepID=A0ABD3QFQ1_9STRA